MTKEFATNPDPSSAPTAAVPPAGRVAATDSDVLIALLDGGAGEKVGPFRIEKQLGKGGMGWVFKAWDDSLERPVALKVIAPELARHEESLARLRTEARSAARLSHQHIVAVYSFGQEHGLPYIAMEYLEGQDLAALLEKRGAMSLTEGLRLIRESAEALEYAERQNVIHRDIKPSNILVTTSGSAKVMDFGLAKRVDVDAKLTATGIVVGTPAYMAPEQAMGKQVDFRADMYSLGCTLFAALTGKAPFQGTGPVDIMMKHINEDLPIPPEWAGLKNGRLVEVLKRMTMKEPGARYIAWSDVVADLRMLEGNHDTLTIQTKALPRNAGAKRRPPMVAIALALAVPLVGGGVWLAMRKPSAPPPDYRSNASSGAAAVNASAVLAPAPTPAPVLATSAVVPPTPIIVYVPQPVAAQPTMDAPQGIDSRDQRRLDLIEGLKAGNFEESAVGLEGAMRVGDLGPMVPGGDHAFPLQVAAFRAAAATDAKLRAASGKAVLTRQERIDLAKKAFSSAAKAKDAEALWEYFLYLKVIFAPDVATAEQWLKDNHPKVLAPQARAAAILSIEMLGRGPGRPGGQGGGPGGQGGGPRR